MSGFQFDMLDKADGGTLKAGSVVIGTSWGNDSVALVQWCVEAGLTDVTCLYNDTGWSWLAYGNQEAWSERVERMEAWARSLGFKTAQTKSIGMETLVHRRRGWPRQGMQFCTDVLKIDPTINWLARNDPNGVALCMNGKRRAESTVRSETPEWIMSSPHHGYRRLRQPLFDHTTEERDALIIRAGHEVLPHKSRECICVNANAEDLQTWPEEVVATVERIEADLGVSPETGKPKTMFRPAKKMGATGIREVIRWAKAGRGKFKSLDDGQGPPSSQSGCGAGFCE